MDDVYGLLMQRTRRLQSLLKESILSGIQSSDRLFKSWQLGAGALILLLIFILYRIYFHPLAHIPGPLLAKVTGHWRSKRYWRGTWHEDILEIHTRWGRVVRIAPNEVAIVDQQAMKRLYGHGQNTQKTKWYNIWDVPNAGPGVFAEQSKKMHAYLRKRVAGAYSMSAILKFERYIQGCLNLMFDRLKKHADAGDTVDMASWTNAFAFDIVGELAYGEQLGHLRTETDVMNLRKSIFDGFFLMAGLGHYPGQGRILNNTVIAFTSRLLGAPNAFAGFQEWSSGKVKERMENSGENKREDMVAHFCRMKDGNGDPATFKEILIEAMNIIGAVADTTSIGMRTCLYYLSIRPDVYRQLQDEVDKYYEDNRPMEPITYTQTQQLPYLQAVVKEAMRFLPSIVFQLLRYAPHNFTVNGTPIPAGTPVGISPLAQNRDKAIWGPDADEFRPDRWLEEEARTKYLDTSNMTFGGNGPRMCIGRDIALVEVHKFIAQLIRNFDFELVDKEHPWHITTYWFAYQHDMQMQLRFRPGRVIKTGVNWECLANTVGWKMIIRVQYCAGEGTRTLFSPGG